MTTALTSILRLVDDPAASFLFGRPVSSDPVSYRSLLVMVNWIADCTMRMRGHEKCPKWDGGTSRLPTRVVDLRSETVRLYVPPPGELSEYVALSYCWGCQQPLVTTKARLATYQQALPVDSLPATVQDAISVTRALLIPFLWVDSLCIIQDSAEDKAHEIANMNNVYKNAFVTFSASRAKTCDDGFLGIQEVTHERISRSATIPIRCPNKQMGSAMLYPARFVEADERAGKVPTDERAWTYQEFLLSPRVVSFYHDGLEFKCASGLFSDDGLKVEEIELRPPLMIRQTRLDALFYRQEARSLLNRMFGRGSLSSSQRKHLRQLWVEIVNEYAVAALTDPDDKLPALSAIASEFHRLWGGRYLAGLWDHQLINDLQWRVGIAVGGEPPTSRRVYQIPSWSWASADRVGFGLFFAHDTDPTRKQSRRVRVLECQVNLVSNVAQFSHVNGGQLTIQAPLKALDVEETWKRFGVDNDMRIGKFWSDFRWMNDGDLHGKLGIPPDCGSLFFLGLSMRAADSYETCGLVLLKSGDRRYERVGLYQVGDDLTRNVSAAQRSALSRWGKNYEVQTISIC